MNHRVFIIVLITALGVLAISNSAKSAEPEDFAKWDFIILGKVVDVGRVREDTRMERFTYRVHVVCDYRDRLKADSNIYLVGTRHEIGSFIIQIPSMTKGTYFVMPLESTDAKDTFRYPIEVGDTHWCPIGLVYPSAVAEKDVPDVKVALSAFGHSLEKPLDDKATDECLNSPNYFLWALGASTRARSATDGDCGEFGNDLETASRAPIRYDASIAGDGSVPPILSLRQALWITHCLLEVVPSKVRLPQEVVLRHLRDYLQRYDADDKENFIP